MTAIMTSRTDCVYCHEPFTKDNPPHRDRKDSKGEYTIENVVLACRDCNWIKSAVLTYEEMLILAPIIKAVRHWRKGWDSNPR